MAVRICLWFAVAMMSTASVSAVDFGYGDPLAFSGAAAVPVIDEVDVRSVDGAVRLRAGVGAAYLQSDEYVYSGDYRVSKLIWQTTAPILRGGVSIDLGYGLSVGAEGSVAMGGDSHMVDYDWLGGDDTFANWTHRSEHPDTNLAHFWTGAATVGYELANVEDAVVRLHGGFQYTDVKWDALGGSYVYSSGPGFRDLQGNFAAGAPGISYRQQMPEVFLGIDGSQYYGNLRLGGLMRAGLVVGSLATDNHWMRNLRFTDAIYAQPSVEFGLDAGYSLGSNVEVTLAGRLKHMLERRGDTALYNTVAGTTQNYSNVDAAAFTQLDITAGFLAKF